MTISNDNLGGRFDFTGVTFSLLQGIQPAASCAFFSSASMSLDWVCFSLVVSLEIVAVRLATVAWLNAVAVARFCDGINGALLKFWCVVMYGVGGSIFLAGSVRIFFAPLRVARHHENLEVGPCLVCCGLSATIVKVVIKHPLVEDEVLRGS